MMIRTRFGDVSFNVNKNSSIFFVPNIRGRLIARVARGGLRRLFFARNYLPSKIEVFPRTKPRDRIDLCKPQWVSGKPL